MWNETAIELTKQPITLQNHQFPSVQSTIPPLLHTATTLFCCRFLNVFWRKRFCHYKRRRSVLFKYFKGSSDWRATQWPYLVGVTGDICYGSTKNASIWPLPCCVEGKAWSIHKHLHYQLHSLHFVCRHIKSLIIIYDCFVLMWF